ncbi:MAG: VUT family protein [Bacilli bacterium]|nr:VUT family protein [Bacilli bacterium]
MHQRSFAPMEWAKREIKLFSTLVRSVPTLVIVLFSCSVIAMNLLSSFTVVNLPYLALTAGVFVSWIGFLLMDIISKHFGPKAANRISWIALSANLVAVGIFFVISQIGTFPRLDMILHGQWSVLLASTIAFIVSALANNFFNYLIGRAFTKNPDGKAAYICRSYISTFLGQAIDNFIFASLAFVVFPLIPGALPVTWTITQVSVCAVTCALVELGFEAVFSPIGYYVTRKWKDKDVGREYIDLYYPQPTGGK